MYVNVLKENITKNFIKIFYVMIAVAGLFNNDNYSNNFEQKQSWKRQVAILFQL